MVDFKTLAKSALPKSVRDTHKLLGRVVKTEARAIVAERLLQARLMNGYAQTQAAALLGYGTSAQLSQWEQCRRPPPLHMLMRASTVYRVSMDYLCGVSPEPDRDPDADDRRRVIRAAEEMFAGASSALADIILSQMKSGGPALEIAAAVLCEGEKYHHAMARFIALNRAHFEADMRGGASLLGMHERFEANALVPARALLERFKFLHASARQSLDRKFRPADTRTSDIFEPAGP